MITQSQQLLLNSLNKFYSVSNNADKLLDVIHHRKGVSLRNIEWFITNYAKSNQTRYKTRDGKDFPVHIQYKASLDGYSKRAFDPFVGPRGLILLYTIRKQFLQRLVN